MGKVDLYDNDVKTAIDRFPPNQTYILPDYAISASFINKIVEKLSILKQKAKEKKLVILTEERVKREANNELLQVHRIKNKIEEEEKNPATPSYEEVCKYIKLMIKQVSNNRSQTEDDNKDSKKKEDSEENQLKLNYYYNLCLYALKQEDGDEAAAAVGKIKSLGGKYEFQEMMLALSYAMKNDINKGTKIFIELLGESQSNRFYNVNLGLVYRRLGNKLLSYKYLAIGSVLLERSEGLYRLSDLMVAADEHFVNGRLQKALQLYKVVVAEDQNKEAWEKLGKIYIQTEELEEATEAFRELQKLDSKSSVAIDYLYQIHDFYFSEGEELFRDRKYKASVVKFEKAMNVLRLPETLKRTAAVYTVLRDKKRSIELLEECEEIKEKLREAEQEILRQSYITKGKKYRAANMIKKAIEFFELAFRLKLDKDVFMFLAYLYKSQNKAEELADLLNRWNKMVELDDRLKQYKEG
ncbi:MAG: hypothetical protein GY786_18495 [Proteobacteria bacterium]|nr:hypothetical protein [Pseudomonadota bacterium]